MIILIKVYLIILLQVILHETGHVIVVIACGMELKRIVIGCEKYSLKIGRLSFSPVCYSGFVEVDENELVSRGKRVIITFFESGSILILILSILCFAFLKNWEGAFFSTVGVISCVVNNLPFIHQSDAYGMISCIKKNTN